MQVLYNNKAAKNKLHTFQIAILSQLGAYSCKTNKNCNNFLSIKKHTLAEQTVIKVFKNY
jgi:hypothetical protein